MSRGSIQELLSVTLATASRAALWLPSSNGRGLVGIAVVRDAFAPRRLTFGQVETSLERVIAVARALLIALTIAALLIDPINPPIDNVALLYVLAIYFAASVGFAAMAFIRPLYQWN